MTCKQKKKVGILISPGYRFYDFRRILDTLNQHVDLYLYGDPENLSPEDKKKYKIRAVKAPKKSFLNSLWFILFSAFGKIPRCKNNFFIAESCSILSLRGMQRVGRKLLLYLRVFTPNFINFDFFASKLKLSTETMIDDIDVFFYLTQIGDIFLLARFLKSNKKIISYVYSWDHPFKHSNLSYKISKYLTWNDDITKDLVELQGIGRNRIKSIGASQLCYIFDYINDNEKKSERPYEFDYFYYACGTLEPLHVEQEIKVIKLIAGLLNNINKNIFLVVRSYPSVSDIKTYNEIESIPNIVIDANFRKSEEKLFMNQSELYDKLNKIKGAKAIIHVGSTIAVEASYFNTPILQISFEDFDYGVSKNNPLNLNNFIHQWHLQRYLLLGGFPNVIRAVNKLEDTMKNVLQDPSPFLKYNEKIRSYTPLRSNSDICNDIIAEF